MSPRSVTIVDIARELGISKTTVSSALHGSGRVSETTRTLVAETAERLGYVSNRAAQRLRGSRSQSIGLHLFPNSQGRRFYMQFVFGAMEHSSEMSLDLTLLTENHRNPRPRSLWADGMLVLDPAPNDPFIEQAAKTGIPVVAVGALSPEQRALVRGQYSGGQDEFTPIVLDRLRAAGVSRPAIITLREEFEPLWAAEAREIYMDWARREGIPPLVLPTGFWPSENEIERILDALDDEGDIDGALVVQQGIAGPLAKRYRARHGRELWVATLASDPATEQGLERVMAVDLNAQTFGRNAARFLTGLIDRDDGDFEWRVNRDVALLVPGRDPEYLLAPPLEKHQTSDR
ncbi:LacI family DNA-binding transcriptional regulator [Leucobacter triazinivorans]|uniref:LacI family transcriptional regulator n=1 Tax=Leucobacter triazinivorans TaxID=1784719 RepID=A0A4P6KCY9_9MICO|nr:LacI family DNA-binding transcriptional regulator [Leucobacter triazinivorans]QBE48062.1 LacI family transcriptional regulator [Leucobacter triazinivorans]